MPVDRQTGDSTLVVLRGHHYRGPERAEALAAEPQARRCALVRDDTARQCLCRSRARLRRGRRRAVPAIPDSVPGGLRGDLRSELDDAATGDGRVRGLISRGHGLNGIDRIGQRRPGDVLRGVRTPSRPSDRRGPFRDLPPAARVGDPGARHSQRALPDGAVQGDVPDDAAQGPVRRPVGHDPASCEGASEN